jgi:predicted acyl esterase
MRQLDHKLSTQFMPVQSYDKSDPVPAGKAVCVDVSLLPWSVQFHAGEQLRLILSGQAPLPPGGNVAGPSPMMQALPPLQTKNVGTASVHSGGSFDSYLQIPIIEADTPE